MAFIVFIAILALNVTLFVFANRWFGPRPLDSPVKRDAFECGAENITPLPEHVPLYFYQAAVAFVILDVELAFFLPWAVSVRQLGWLGFVVMISYTALLMGGFLYFLKMGGIQLWNPRVMESKKQ